jgi:hypothetical protein
MRRNRLSGRIFSRTAEKSHAPVIFRLAKRAKVDDIARLLLQRPSPRGI